MIFIASGAAGVTISGAAGVTISGAAGVTSSGLTSKPGIPVQPSETLNRTKMKTTNLRYMPHFTARSKIICSDFCRILANQAISGCFISVTVISAFFNAIFAPPRKLGNCFFQMPPPGQSIHPNLEWRPSLHEINHSCPYLISKKLPLKNGTCLVMF